MNSRFLCKSLSRTAYCFKDTSFSSVPGMKVRRTRMDMIQYSNIRDYRQTSDARSKAELSEVEQLLLEVKLTDYLQNELDRCNL
jgi:hypothetical protein